MAKFTVTASEGYKGEVVGVDFVDGVAEVEEDEHPAALAYFRRAGYGVEEIGPKAAAKSAPAKAE